MVGCPKNCVHPFCRRSYLLIQSPIKSRSFRHDQGYVVVHRFVPNNHKIKWYGIDDVKEVTGLLVSNKISLPDEYLVDLRHEFER